MKHKLLTLALALSTTLPLTVNAAVQTYSAVLDPLNNSGVHGIANLLLDGSLLTVNLTAYGLEPNQLHIQHIHGNFDSNGNPINSAVPTLAQDTDGDGFIEVGEGAATYGPIILNLSNPPGHVHGGLDHTGFPTAPFGQINYSETFDLSQQSQFGTEFGKSDLLPLDLREIVIHGMSVNGNVGAGTLGEVDGTAGFKAALPVASGEIFETTVAAPVPEPETYALMLSGLGLLGFSARRRLTKGA